jgi:hypothetical protein
MAVIMADHHTFEHEGIVVEYYPPIIRTQLEKRRIMRALIDAYNLNGQDIPADVWDNWDEFGTAMAQSKADAPWWTSSMATPERIREAFECFMEQDAMLLSKMLTASNAVSVPKKKAVKMTEMSDS